MTHRYYETEIADDASDLRLAILSIPRTSAGLELGIAVDDLLARRRREVSPTLRRMLGRRSEIVHWNGDPALSDVRNVVGLVASRAAGVDVVTRALSTGDREWSPEIRDFTDETMSIPVVPIENSWPKLDSISTAVLSAGGSGAAVGLGVATGALHPVALIVIPAGMVLISVGRGLQVRAAAVFASDLRAQLRELRSLYEDDLIEVDDYEARRTQILDSFYGRPR